MRPKDSGHLLTHAESILNPEIFTHPVWLRFGGRDDIPDKTIDALLKAAKGIQKGNPGNACQILFVCAARQHHAGQNENALQTLKEIQSLAERNRLFEMVIWAKWGICSLYIQSGMQDQAVIHLEDLQKILNQQNEWMLVDYLDVVKDSLLHLQAGSCELEQPNCNDPPNDLLAHTFYWLHHWGNSNHLSNPPFGTQYHQVEGGSALYLSHFFGQSPSEYWKKLVQKIRNSVKPRNSNLNQQPKVQPGPVISTSIASMETRPVFEQKERKTRMAENTWTTTSVVVQMLGQFSLTIQDAPLKIPASRGLSLLKYLIIHHSRNIPREMLMEVFWPESEPESARNNLNVAMHSLRHSLRCATDLEVVRFEDGTYSLVPDLHIWLDVDEFEHSIQEGRRMENRNQVNSAVTEYENAINLYRGDFLADNPYENWTVLDRERLRVAYLDTLDGLSRIYLNQDRFAACANLCQLILSRDSCREDAHCRLMRSYSRLGQEALALRQYQTCVEALRGELDVEPAPETRHLFEQIRSHRRV